MKAHSGIEELHAVCMRIHGVFSRSGTRMTGGLNIVQVEDSVREEIGIAYRHSRLIARSLLVSKRFGAFASFDRGVHEDIDDLAHEVALRLFSRRRETGFFEIVYVLRLLFEKNPEPGPDDTYLYLRGTLRRLVDKHYEERIRTETPFLYHLSDRLRYFCERDPRFELEGGLVIFRGKGGGEDGMQAFDSGEIESECAGIRVPFRSMSRLIPDATLAVFSRLAEITPRAPAVSLRGLRGIVYALTGHYLEIRYSPPPPLSPWSSMLMRSMLRALRDTFDKAGPEYGWRTGYTETEKSAVTAAAFDYIFDELMMDDPSHSLFSCLADHMPGLERDEFEKRYKGSLQNLVRWIRRRMKGILDTDG